MYILIHTVDDEGIERPLVINKSHIGSITTNQSGEAVITMTWGKTIVAEEHFDLLSDILDVAF